MNGRRDLVVGFELDGRGFARGADMVSNRMDRMGRESRDFGRRASKGFGRANRGLLELSRGAEDFAVSFGTQGFAGGLRGAGNNLSQFAAMMHPLAGAITGLGIAGASMWLGFNKGADEAIDKAKDFRKELADLRTNQNFKIDLQKARGETDDFGALKQKSDNARAIADRFDGQLRSTRQVLATERRRLEQLRGGDGSRQRLAEVFDPTAFGARKEKIANLETREKQLEEQFGEAFKAAQDARRPLDIAEAKRNREGRGGEQMGINQQRADFQKSLAARRQAAADRKRQFEETRDAELRQRSRGRQGGTLNVMGPMLSQAPQTSTPAGLASIATKGSAGAARAIAEAKNQSNIQKQQLDVAKQQLEELKKSSQVGQADVVIESFSGVA